MLFRSSGSSFIFASSFAAQFAQSIPLIEYFFFIYTSFLPVCKYITGNISFVHMNSYSYVCLKYTIISIKKQYPILKISLLLLKLIWNSPQIPHKKEDTTVSPKNLVYSSTCSIPWLRIVKTCSSASVYNTVLPSFLYLTSLFCFNTRNWWEIALCVIFKILAISYTHISFQIKHKEFLFL